MDCRKNNLDADFLALADRCTQRHEKQCSLVPTVQASFR